MNNPTKQIEEVVLKILSTLTVLLIPSVAMFHLCKDPGLMLLMLLLLLLKDRLDHIQGIIRIWLANMLWQVMWGRCIIRSGSLQWWRWWGWSTWNASNSLDVLLVWRLLGYLQSSGRFQVTFWWSRFLSGIHCFCETTRAYRWAEVSVRSYIHVQDMGGSGIRWNRCEVTSSRGERWGVLFWERWWWVSWHVVLIVVGLWECICWGHCSWLNSHTCCPGCRSTSSLVSGCFSISDSGGGVDLQQCMRQAWQIASPPIWSSSAFWDMNTLESW